jgi:hypothetical protein
MVVGMSPRLVRNLWNPIAAKVGFDISHIVHPSFDRRVWRQTGLQADAIDFLREDITAPVPAPDRELLASLERDGVPTIHNMIMSDRFVGSLPYEDALSYSTLLTRRLLLLLQRNRPSAIVGDFDNLHASLTYAVARQLGIPWFAMYYASLPSGCAALCTELTPASMIVVDARPEEELQALAEEYLGGFERRTVRAAAYVPPDLLTPASLLARIPGQLRSVAEVWARRKQRDYLRFTDYANSYSIGSLTREAYRLRRNTWNLRREKLLVKPPRGQYAFFGLHMQPESSIDVFAHFFSNQVRVVELMARSLPPTHMLLIKLHKSDVPNYSAQDLERFRSFPGVQVVSPYADTYELIKGADLIFSIQGTIGLEGAMLGKPVIMFGDSPLKTFPNVSTFGRTVDLPQLVRKKLGETRASRRTIASALARYLAAFHPASSNDWNIVPGEPEIDNYVRMFRLLRDYVESDRTAPRLAAYRADL